MEDNIIKVTVIDREGVAHELEAPTDMSMNMMEVCKSYELPVEGTCGGMAMCASCHMYISPIINCQKNRMKKRICWMKLFL